MKITDNSFDNYNANFYNSFILDYSFKDIKVTKGSLIEGYLKLKSNNKLLHKLKK